MASLSSYLNRDKNKIAIGFGNLDGYAAATNTMYGKDNKPVFSGISSLGGEASTGQLDGLIVEVDTQTNFIKSQNLKQIVCTLVAAYSFPLIGTDGRYIMASSPNGNSYGFLGGQYKGVPSSLSNVMIRGVESAISSNPVSVGIGLDLTKWGTDYLNEFFRNHSMTSTDLLILSQKGYLCAEVVVHDGNIGTSGKVFYANVVDNINGGEYTAWVSPAFAVLNNYKNLGIKMDAISPSGAIYLGDGTYQAAGNFSYDYKTGEMNGLDCTQLRSMMATGQTTGTINISPTTNQQCRIRLFIPKDRVDDAAAIIKKNIPKEFSEVNKNLTYSGGKTVQTAKQNVMELYQGKAPRYNQKQIRAGGTVYGTKPEQGDYLVDIPASQLESHNLVQSVLCPLDSRGRVFALHKLVMPMFEQAMAELRTTYGEQKLKQLNIDKPACGVNGHYYRVHNSNGLGAVSMHSFGVAIDFYPEKNGMSQHHDTALFATNKEYTAFLNIMEKHGFKSLGRTSDFDWMHFQYADY